LKKYANAFNKHKFCPVTTGMYANYNSIVEFNISKLAGSFHSRN